jgi:hypothetical protein
MMMAAAMMGGAPPYPIPIRRRIGDGRSSDSVNIFSLVCSIIGYFTCFLVVTTIIILVISGGWLIS